MSKDFRIPISAMAAAVQPSATLAAGAKARQLKAEGINVFDFSLGEPDFPTPEHICAAAVKAMKQRPDALHARHRHRRAAHRRRPRLSRRPTASTYTAEQVIISNGAKHSLHNALAATVGPGDEVIIPTPYWVSYSDLVQMTGRDVRPGADDAGSRLQDDAGPARRPPSRRDSRLLMLNSPSNPTGSRLHAARNWRRWPTWSWKPTSPFSATRFTSS